MTLATPSRTAQKLSAEAAEATPSSQNAAAPASDRDRLLAALMVGPRITDEEAEQIRLVVSEAREASIATASA